jgi:DnaJ-class molecular chaperone
MPTDLFSLSYPLCSAVNYLRTSRAASSPCLECGGIGEVEDYQDFGMTTVYAGMVVCPACGGDG